MPQVSFDQDIKPLMTEADRSPPSLRLAQFFAHRGDIRSKGASKERIKWSGQH